MQCMILGNFPIKLIDFTTLQNILRNVTLSLPNGYELIVGTKTENIHLYYQIAKVSMIANAHHIKLIVNIPLKTYNKDFALYRLITLPERVSDDKFVQYSVDFPHLGLQNDQHNYILLTESQYNQCSKGDITICPAHNAIFGARQLTCEFSLYFRAVLSPALQNEVTSSPNSNYSTTRIYMHL